MMRSKSVQLVIQDHELLRIIGDKIAVGEVEAECNGWWHCSRSDSNRYPIQRVQQLNCVVCDRGVFRYMLP